MTTHTQIQQSHEILRLFRRWLNLLSAFILCLVVQLHHVTPESTCQISQHLLCGLEFTFSIQCKETDIEHLIRMNRENNF